MTIYKKIPDSCGIIMAGGKSSRMGDDKLLIKIAGKPLYSIAYEMIIRISETVFLSTNKTDICINDVKIIPDVYKEVGPAGGIFSCLDASVNENNVFLSVDTPFVTKELYLYLFDNLEDFDCIIPIHDNKKEPLLGIYKKRCASAFQKSIGNKQYKLIEILKELNTKFIEINEENEFFTEYLFFNINRPEDLQKARNFNFKSEI